jgi:hypothetical protein
MIEPRSTRSGKGAAYGVREYRGQLIRMGRSLARQVDDPQALKQALDILAEARQEADWAVTAAVLRMHAVDGVSWSEIARATDMAPNNARKRWGLWVIEMGEQGPPPSEEQTS